MIFENGETEPLPDVVVKSIRRRVLKPSGAFTKHEHNNKLGTKIANLKLSAPREVREKIENTVSHIFPSYSEDKAYSDAGLISVFGLMAGYMYARKIDPYGIAARLNQEFSAGLSDMEFIAQHGVHTADDFLINRGYAMGLLISRYLDGNYLKVSEGTHTAAQDRNRLAMSAFGWPISMAETILVETAIRENNCLGFSNRRSLQRQAEWLASPKLTVCFNEPNERFEPYTDKTNYQQ